MRSPKFRLLGVEQECSQGAKHDKDRETLERSLNEVFCFGVADADRAADELRSAGLAALCDFHHSNISCLPHSKGLDCDKIVLWIIKRS